jgi:biotin carboxylase
VWEANRPRRRLQFIDGHVIAARITAENPEEGFQPTSGNITELR